MPGDHAGVIHTAHRLAQVWVITAGLQRQRRVQARLDLRLEAHLQLHQRLASQFRFVAAHLGIGLGGHLLEHHVGPGRVIAGDLQKLLDAGAHQQLNPDTSRNGRQRCLSRMPQLFIELRQLLHRHNAQPYLPPSKRATVELDLLVEQRTEVIADRRGTRLGRWAVINPCKRRLIQALGLLHINVGIDFHGECQDREIRVLVWRANPLRFHLAGDSEAYEKTGTNLWRFVQSLA